MRRGIRLNWIAAQYTGHCTALVLWNSSPVRLMFTDHKHKNLIWDVLCLTSNWKVTAWRTWARDCLYQKHTQYPLQINLTAWVYDPSVNRTAERATLRQKSIKVKSSQRQNWTAVSNIMVQTVVTSKHEYWDLVFTNHGKEDGIYPLKEIAKHKTKIKDLL
jgi:hypothetical protein